LRISRNSNACSIGILAFYIGGISGVVFVQVILDGLDGFSDLGFRGHFLVGFSVAFEVYFGGEGGACAHVWERLEEFGILVDLGFFVFAYYKLSVPAVVRLENTELFLTLFFGCVVGWFVIDPHTYPGAVGCGFVDAVTELLFV